MIELSPSERADLVKEFFPDAPEKCQSCPGLFVAALRLSDAIEATRSFNDVTTANDIEEATESKYANPLFDTLADLIPRVSAAANTLYSDCTDGATFIDAGEAGKEIHVDKMTLCQSNSPLVFFTPYSMGEVFLDLE